jgi:hypothetical protein
VSYTKHYIRDDHFYGPSGHTQAYIQWDGERGYIYDRSGYTRYYLLEELFFRPIRVHSVLYTRKNRRKPPHVYLRPFREPALGLRTSETIREFLPLIRPKPLSRMAQPFSHPDWIFEIKYDGFRVLARAGVGRMAALGYAS